MIKFTSCFFVSFFFFFLLLLLGQQVSLTHSNKSHLWFAEQFIIFHTPQLVEVSGVIQDPFITKRLHGLSAPAQFSVGNHWRARQPSVLASESTGSSSIKLYCVVAFSSSLWSLFVCRQLYDNPSLFFSLFFFCSLKDFPFQCLMGWASTFASEVRRVVHSPQTYPEINTLKRSFH